MLVLILRSAHTEVLPQTRTRVRASRRMRTGEEARALMLRDASQRGSGVEAPVLAMLLSMRAGAGGAFWRNDPTLVLAKTIPTECACLARAKNQPAGVENERRGGRPVSGLFFTGRCATRACERLISFSFPPAVSSPVACTPWLRASCRRGR